MKIICENGATKGDWRVIENGVQICQVQTPGTNVSAMEPETVRGIILDAVRLLPPGPYEAVHFYTAGVLSEAILKKTEETMREAFPGAAIELQTDLIAAVRAACGHAPGIAVILGTGSNSCQYDGQRIVKQIKAGGFILGDEGSAASIGRLFLADLIKGLVPQPIAAAFAEKYASDYASIVDNVYHNPGSPSAYLGSLCPFILSYYDDLYIRQLVNGSFQAFIDRSLRQYEIDKYPVGIVGGFGHALQYIIRPLFEQNGIRIRAFIPSPIEELVRYHER